MPAPNYSDIIEKNMLGHIKYRDAIRNGEVVADNEDGTYDVKIALSDKIYPSIETLTYEMKFAVGEIAVLSFEYGNKEIPKIMGHGKKIAQDPVDIIVDNSGTARVVTLDAYSLTSTTAYLEGRISLGGAGNCTTRGFQYGTTTAYGLDTHTDGSYGNGSYAIQITSLTEDGTYHFRAYIIDENGDTRYGADKTFGPGTIDIGAEAIDRNSSIGTEGTWINVSNTANATGVITSIETWARTNVAGAIVATFYSTGGVTSTKIFTARDSEAIGSIASGAKRTYEVEIDVVQGDYIGIYIASGELEMTAAGGKAGTYYLTGDQTACSSATFTLYDDQEMSLYGTGLII